MSQYISIKGWIECDYNDAVSIKEVIKKYLDDEENIIESDIRRLYQKGWVIQESSSLFVFYGGEVKNHYLDYIKNQIMEMSKKIYNNKSLDFLVEDELDGVFYVDYEEGDRFKWVVINGGLSEYQRDI